MAAPPTAPERLRADDIVIPRPIGLAAIGLCVMTIIFAFVARHTGIGVAKLDSPALVTLEFTALPAPGGGGTELRRTDGAARLLIADGMGGPDEFARQVLMTVMREREARRLPAAAPFQLQLLGSGQPSLLDPLTGVRVDLASQAAFRGSPFDRLLRDRQPAP